MNHATIIVAVRSACAQETVRQFAGGGLIGLAAVGACGPCAMAASEPSGDPIACSSTAPDREPATAAEALDKVRTAINYAAIQAQPQGIILRGTAAFAGVEGEGTFMFTPAGEALTEITGPLGITFGYDGVTVWERNEGGITRVLSLTDRDLWLTNIEFATGRWLSGTTALTFELDASRSTTATIALSFARPGTTITGFVEIDRASGEPRRITTSGASGDDVLELSDYAEFRGARIFRSHIHKTGDGVTMAITAREIAAAPTFFRNPYQPIYALPDNFRFDPGVSPTVQATRAPTQHHLVKALVNGQDVGWFIFDSGAGSEVISTKAVEALKLEAIGKIPVTGVGGSIDAALYRPDSLTLGPLTIDRPLLIAIDFSALSTAMNIEIAGVIGYGVLGRSVAVIDDEALTIELHDSTTYQLKDARWSELLLYGRHPAVKGSVEGHEGYLRLDTGAAQMTITVHAPAVARFKMLDDRAVTTEMLGGVGGMVEARAGVLKSVAFGGRTFENVSATFALPDKGSMNDPGTLGNVGGVLMKSFILVFDYPNRRMAFVPRAEEEAEPAPATQENTPDN